MVSFRERTENLSLTDNMRVCTKLTTESTLRLSFNSPEITKIVMFKGEFNLVDE